MPVRVPVAALVLVLGVGVGVAAIATGLVSTGSSPSRGVHQVAGMSARPTSGLAVLHVWDAQRAAAWAAGDTDALARLYVPGSSAGAADLAPLRRYAARGLVVRGMRMQVLGARVLVARPRRLVLEITDRLAAAIAVRRGDPEAARRLPVDAARTRRLELRRIRGHWLMAVVSGPVVWDPASGTASGR